MNPFCKDTRVIGKCGGTTDICCGIANNICALNGPSCLYCPYTMCKAALDPNNLGLCKKLSNTLPTIEC